MRGALLGTVTLIVIAGLWSSVELYVGLVLPAQQRAANGEAAQAVGDSSSDATRAGGRRARCAELLVAGGCDGPASAVPDECAPLCRAITASDSPPNATGAAAPDRGGVRARGAHPAAEARAKVGAALLPGVPGVRRSSFGFSGAQPANAQPSTPAKRLVAPSDGFGNPIGTDCGALVAAGACFVDMRYMLLESPCAALCARYRGLPPEARQWVAPRSCYGRHAPALAAAGPGPTLDTNGYFQLVGGREQMNKNRFLVIDALFYAKALNRTFVEPAMRNSRIVRPPRPASATPPAERARAWAAERVAAFVRAGIRPPRDDAPANYTLGFGTYWEMKPVCHLHRTIDVLTFEQLSVAHGLRSVLVLPGTRDVARIGAMRLATAAHVRGAFRPFAAYPVIQMDAFYRSTVTRPVTLTLSRRLEAFARRLSAQLLGGRYVAVQWRSETVSREQWEGCVQTVSGAILRLVLRLRLKPAQVLFLSDVFPNTSDTDRRDDAARAFAIRAFEARLPGMMSHGVHAALAMIVDSGVKAITEQFLAVNAPYFFAASIGESECAKAGSGFVETIVQERDMRKLESYPLLHMRTDARSGRGLQRAGARGGGLASAAVNLAPLSACSQSSTPDFSNCTLAINENNATAARTAVERTPWFALDLGAPALVTSIEIDQPFAASPAGAELAAPLAGSAGASHGSPFGRLEKLRVRVFNESGARGVPSRTQDADFEVEVHSQFERSLALTIGAVGRYVRVEPIRSAFEEPAALAIGELRVYGDLLERLGTRLGAPPSTPSGAPPLLRPAPDDASRRSALAVDGGGPGTYGGAIVVEGAPPARPPPPPPPPPAGSGFGVFGMRRSAQPSLAHAPPPPPPATRVVPMRGGPPRCVGVQWWWCEASDWAMLLSLGLSFACITAAVRCVWGPLVADDAAAAAAHGAPLAESGARAPDAKGAAECELLVCGRWRLACAPLSRAWAWAPLRDVRGFARAAPPRRHAALNPIGEPHTHAGGGRELDDNGSDDDDGDVDGDTDLESAPTGGGGVRGAPTLARWPEAIKRAQQALVAILGFPRVTTRVGWCDLAAGCEALSSDTGRRTSLSSDTGRRTARAVFARSDEGALARAPVPLRAARPHDARPSDRASSTFVKTTSSDDEGDGVSTHDDIDDDDDDDKERGRAHRRAGACARCDAGGAPVGGLANGANGHSERRWAGRLRPLPLLRAAWLWGMAPLGGGPSSRIAAIEGSPARGPARGAGGPDDDLASAQVCSCRARAALADGRQSRKPSPPPPPASKSASAVEQLVAHALALQQDVEGGGCTQVVVGCADGVRSPRRPLPARTGQLGGARAHGLPPPLSPLSSLLPPPLPVPRLPLAGGGDSPHADCAAGADWPEPHADRAAGADWLAPAVALVDGDAHEIRGGMTVFFASPLVMTDAVSRREQALDLLDVERECRLLQRALRASESGRHIPLRFAVATPDAIRQQLTLGSGARACSVVHLSGHGHPSSLVLEDGSGGAHLLGGERLRALFSAGGDHADVKLLVVNCCHSSSVGRSFVEAGVRHVVASPMQVQDAAAAIFTSSFYLALGVGRTIAAAFQIATEAVRTSPRLPACEADKFELLPKDASHDEVVWPAAAGGGAGALERARAHERTVTGPARARAFGGGCLGMLAPAGAPALVRPASASADGLGPARGVSPPPSLCLELPPAGSYKCASGGLPRRPVQHVVSTSSSSSSSSSRSSLSSCSPVADCSRAPSPSRTRCEHSVAASAGAARASGAGARTAGAQNFGAHGSSDGVDELEFGEEATARLPCLPEDFLGRQFEMHAVCRALRTRRLVVVSARADTHGRAAGLGTSTVAVAVARYLAVRGVYAHGVSLARCAGIADVGGLSRALRAALLDEDGSAGPAGTGGDAGARLATEREDAAGDGLHWLARVRNRHALVVLDGLDAALVPGCARAGPSSGACEDGVASSSDGDGEGAAVRALLEAVFSQTERLQLVLTLRSHLGPWAALLPVKAVAVPVGPLAPVDAARLFVRRTTRSITANELDRLVRPGAGGGIGVAGALNTPSALHAPLPTSGPGGLIERLAAHRLVTRCGGHPLRILRAAARVTHDVADLATLVSECAPAADPARAELVA